MNAQQLLYANWLVGRDGSSSSFQATRTMPDTDIVSVQLEAGRTALYEGWWPFPAEGRSVAVSGVCLFDKAWRLQFAPRGKGNPPAVRTLALPSGRSEAYGWLRQGRRAEQLFVPVAPGRYHEALIRWQVSEFLRLRPQRILYHIPLDEYRWYVGDLEELLGRSLPTLRDRLDAFTKQVLALLTEACGELANRLEFIRPMQCGAASPDVSYLFPYVRSDAFGVTVDDLYGIEDLTELGLSYEASARSGRVIPPCNGLVFCLTGPMLAQPSVPIPVRCCITAIPHPYLVGDSPVESLPLDGP
jgi:hypothetical protein